MATLGQRVKQLRKHHSLTQKQLGEIIGVSARAIQYVESDESGLDNKNLIALADYFNVSLDYLVGRVDDNHESSPNLQQWLQLGKKLTPEERVSLAQALDKLRR